MVQVPQSGLLMLEIGGELDHTNSQKTVIALSITIPAIVDLIHMTVTVRQTLYRAIAYHIQLNVTVLQHLALSVMDMGATIMDVRDLGLQDIIFVVQQTDQDGVQIMVAMVAMDVQDMDATHILELQKLPANNVQEQNVTYAKFILAKPAMDIPVTPVLELLVTPATHST